MRGERRERKNQTRLKNRNTNKEYMIVKYTRIIF